MEYDLGDGARGGAEMAVETYMKGDLYKMASCCTFVSDNQTTKTPQVKLIFERLRHFF